MDIRKVKKLIELLDETGVAEQFGAHQPPSERRDVRDDAAAHGLCTAASTGSCCGACALRRSHGRSSCC